MNPYRRVENNFYCVKIKGAGDPARQSVAATCLLATRHTALRGQDLYPGFGKEQENHGRRWQAKMSGIRKEKAESSEAPIVWRMKS